MNDFDHFNWMRDRVCPALFTWFRVMSELSDEDFARAQGHLNGPVRPQDVMAKLPLWIQKSNLLARLIYDGEELRTEQCPVHKGHWSGCQWGYPPCDCQKVMSDGHVGYDSNVTGWLLAGNPPATARCGGRSIADAPGKNMVKVCLGVSGHPGECDWSQWFDYREPPEHLR